MAVQSKLSNSNPSFTNALFAEKQYAHYYKIINYIAQHYQSSNGIKNEFFNILFWNLQIIIVKKSVRQMIIHIYFNWILFVRYLCTNEMRKCIKIHVTKINKSSKPKVIVCLLDFNCAETQMKNLLLHNTLDKYTLINSNLKQMQIIHYIFGKFAILVHFAQIPFIKLLYVLCIISDDCDKSVLFLLFECVSIFCFCSFLFFNIL